MLQGRPSFFPNPETGAPPCVHRDESSLCHQKELLQRTRSTQSHQNFAVALSFQPVLSKPDSHVTPGMIFLSDEDVDVKRLLARWLNSQPKELRAGLSGWVDDMFYR